MPTDTDDNLKVSTADDGSLLVTLPPEEKEAEPDEEISGPPVEETVNLVTFLTTKQQDSVAQTVWDNWHRDDQSRQKRLKKIKEGIELAAMVTKEKNWPWQNCANVSEPLLASAAIQIHARLFDMMFPAYPAPIYQVFPLKLEEEHIDRANRTEMVFNDVIRNEIEDYEIGYDDSLWQLVLVGSMFRRVVFNDYERRIDVSWIPADDFVVNHHCRVSSPLMKGVPRYTWVQRKTMDELRELGNAGFYENLDEIKEGTSDAEDGEVKRAVQGIDGVDPGEDENPTDERHVVLEQHCRVTLPKLRGKKKHPAFDGKRHWVVVTIEEASKKILRLTLREEPDPRDLVRYQKELDTALTLDKDPEEIRPPRMREVHQFIHARGFQGEGFYGLGLIDLLGGLNKANNTLLNQFIDALTARNAGGGFISSNIRGPRGALSFQPGLYQPVNAPGAAIKESIVHMQMPDPNPGVVKVIEYNDQQANRTAANADLMSGEAGGDRETATSMKIRTEMMMKQISVLMRRIKLYQQAEGMLLWRLCSLFLDEDRARVIVDGNGEPQEVAVVRDDFVPDGRVMPTADTTISSRTQRIQQAMALHEVMGKTPSAANNPALMHASLSGVFTAYGDYEKRRLLGPLPAPPKPEPVGLPQYEENVRIALGQPVEVRETDDHDRHLLEMAEFENATPFAMVKGNQQLMAEWAKHKQDHLTYQYLTKKRRIDAEVNGGPAPSMVGQALAGGAPGMEEPASDEAFPGPAPEGPPLPVGGGGGEGGESFA